MWSHFNLLSCKQQRDEEMWLKTQMKKVISLARKWALLYKKLKEKIWSLTVQCKAIATLVIIAGMLDTGENIWLNPSLLTKLGRTHSFLSKWVISPFKKTFACGPTLREPFVRGYLHGSRQTDFRTTQILEGWTTYHLVKTCKVVVRLTVNCLSTEAFLAKSGWVSFYSFYCEAGKHETHLPPMCSYLSLH